MIKLTNIKRTILIGIATITMMASTMTAFAEEPAQTPDIPNVAKDTIYLDVSQTWTVKGTPSIGQKVTYTVTQDETSTWYDESVTLLPVEPVSKDQPNTFLLDGDGATTKLKFDTKRAGVFTFFIKAVEDENVNKNPGGYTYDDTTYTIRAYVKRNDSGELEVATITAQKSGSEGKSASIAFTHEFKGVNSGEITDEDGKVVADPPVQKVVKGDEPRATDKFKFTITPYDENPEVVWPVDPDTGEENHELIVQPSKKKTGEFGEFTFSKVGIYKYDVKEVVTNAEGYTYDTIVYTVIYEVTKGADGQLTCTRTFEVNGKAVDTPLKVYKFTNSFTDPDKHKHHKHHDDDTPVTPVNQITEPGEVPEITTPDTPEIAEGGDMGGGLATTGDDSNMILYAIIAALAAAGLTTWTIYRKKAQH